MDYNTLFSLAIIIGCTKLFGIFSRKINLPAVVGALLVRSGSQK